jgi:hypothetical protein
MGNINPLIVGLHIRFLFDLEQCYKTFFSSSLTKELVSSVCVTAIFIYSSFLLQGYKKFYDLKLQLFVISYSICPWPFQPFQPSPVFVGAYLR